MKMPVMLGTQALKVVFSHEIIMQNICVLNDLQYHMFVALIPMCFSTFIFLCMYFVKNNIRIMFPLHLTVGFTTFRLSPDFGHDRNRIVSEVYISN